MLPVERELGPIPRSVCVIGLGGLGCPASLALAQLGVSSLTLVDPDVIEESNLHRQPWHHPSDVGKPKALSAAGKLAARFPKLEVRALVECARPHNAEALFRGSEVIIDATDGLGVKFALSDVAVATGTPLVYAGVVAFEGLALRVEPGGPCLRCLFERPPEAAPSCAQAGIMGSMAGVLGGLQGLLACTPSRERGAAALHVVDGLALSVRRVRVRRRGDCDGCAAPRKPVWSGAETPECSTSESTSPAKSAP